MENEELLKKLSENSEKSLKFQRISTCCLAGMLVVFLVSAIAIVPSAVVTIKKINDVAVAAEGAVSDATDLVAEMDKTAKELQETGKGMNTLLNDNAEKITESLDKMSQIDFGGLNDAIKDLQDAVGPFANFMNKFR